MSSAQVPELFADAPLRELALPFPPREVCILVLREPLALVEHAEPEAEVYWGELWPAAVVLADSLLAGEIPLPPGPEPVLELGCGVGLASVAAALAGAGRARVLATDREPRALRLTAANAARNGVASCVETKELDWTEEYPGRHRLILAADCLYAPDAGQEILKFIRQALQPGRQAGARAVVVDPDRWSARDFGLLARQAGFRVRTWRRAVPFSFSLGAKALLPHSGPPTDADVRGDQPIEATFYELTF